MTREERADAYDTLTLQLEHIGALADAIECGALRDTQRDALAYQIGEKVEAAYTAARIAYGQV